MGFESSPPIQVDYEAQVTQLVEANPDAIISHKGAELPLKTFVQMQSMCERKFEPGVDAEKEMASDLVNIVAENGLVVTEELQHLVKPKEIADNKTDELSTTPTKDKTKPVETVTSDVEVAPTAIRATKSSIEIKQPTEVKPHPVIHPEIMARVVKLETKAVVVKPVTEKVELIEQPPILKLTAEKTAPKIISEFPVKQEELATVLEETSSEPLEKLPTILLPISEIQIEQSVQEDEPVLAEVRDTEYVNLTPEDILLVSAIGIEDEATIEEIEPAVISTESTAELVTEATTENELSDIINQVEVFAETEKTPAVAAAEFMIQVFPAVTQEVYERVQAMEPVEAAEVAAQIETISIVADRLHELVVQGNTDGEEAQQIEAYLRREYEQILVSVGIEPTEEILNDFIRYIYSAEYQIQAKLNMNDVEVIDEGTHEKKLFDEQGVFSRAHAASLNLSRRLDKTIGRLVVNYFST